MIRKRPPKPIVIHAGELIVGKGRRPLYTLLGSCISVTIWHPIHKFSGMCHFALPKNPAGSDPNKLDARYGEDCFLLFEKSCREKGVFLKECHANIIGGGNVMPRRERPQIFSETLEEDDNLPIGDKNALFAIEQATKLNLQIKQVAVGEFGYRKLKFFPNSGEIEIQFKKIE